MLNLLHLGVTLLTGLANKCGRLTKVKKVEQFIMVSVICVISQQRNYVLFAQAFDKNLFAPSYCALHHSLLCLLHCQ